MAGPSTRRRPAMTGRCPRCLLRRQPDCLCAEAAALVGAVALRTQLVVVRHLTERFRPSNSARLLALAFPGTELHDYGDPLAPFDASSLATPGTWLLYPDGTLPPADAPPPARLVVVDGSWHQTRRMVQRIPALRGLPRLSLPAAATAPPRLRRAPSPDRLATADAVAAALALLGEEEAAAALARLFDRLVERLAAQSTTGPSPKDP